MRQASSAFPDLIAIPPKEMHVRGWHFGSNEGGHYKRIVKTTGFNTYAIECKMNKYMSPNELSDLLRLQKDYGLVAVRAWLGKDNEIQMEYLATPRELRAFPRSSPS